VLFKKFFYDFWSFGGGIINMKEKWVVLAIFSLVLPFCMSFAAAASEPTNQTVVGKSDAQEIHATNDVKDEQINNTGKTAQTTSYSLNHAAGSAAAESGNTSTLSSGQAAGITVSQSELFSAASRVKSFINTNHRLPTTVTVGDNQLSMAQYLQLVTQGFYDLNYGKSRSIVVDDVNDPSAPKASVVTGNIPKSEYVQIARSIIDYIDNNGQAPNYVSSSIGSLRFDSLIYSFSKIVNFYESNNRMPTNVAVSPLYGQSSEGTLSDSSLQKYLVATTNCQSTSSTIKNLAASITAGKTTTYAKAQAIFNWVRDHLSYSYYYDSKKGALGALSARSANCCDTSHLVVALSRAAGMPARYQHGNCKFSDGWYGHVWAQIYVNGKWYYADAISNSNTFGAINNWSSATIYGSYASLPF
jgi:hypothetical protein